MQPFVVNQENYEQEVQRADSPVLLDFWAEWCGPCQMIAPIVEEIAQEKPALRVGKVNVDADAPLAMSLGVSSIPTLIYFENGQEKARLVGYQDKAAILSQLPLAE